MSSANRGRSRIVKIHAADGAAGSEEMTVLTPRNGKILAFSVSPDAPTLKSGATAAWDASLPQAAEPVPLLQFVALGDPSGGDDVCTTGVPTLSTFIQPPPPRRADNIDAVADAARYIAAIDAAAKLVKREG